MLPAFKFHHIGVAVFDIEATAAFYEQGGYHRSSVILDPIQNVSICWLTRDGGPNIELVAPIDDTSPVCKTLERNGITPYHICYVVPDLDEASIQLRKQHYIMVRRPVEAVAFNSSRVAFFYNKDVGLIELVEEPAILLG